mmetsp:Transcript_49232/g.77856  ORF Transcript_49232/g.77856 Transcript_49232/m.77856 type:complete len:319 (+) Transcript_49232:50-1006(+)
MNVALIFFCALGLTEGSYHPAKDMHASMRQEMPTDPLKYVQDILASESERKTDTDAAKILVVGDSWANVVGTFGPLPSFLERRLTNHSCKAATTSIAIPGTESGDWASAAFMSALKLAAKGRDYVFIVLMGNDALDKMPDCADEKKTSAECGDQLFATAVPNMYKIVDAVHEANPTARVVGFGYDTMFGGLGCSLVTHDLFPQCWGKEGGGNRCFNTQFLRIQDVWDTMAANRSFVDSASILGATQVAGGDTKASTDPKNRHIDMDKQGPAQYWPDYLGCFHPGVLGAQPGAEVVMEEFYKVYWSKQPMCTGKTGVVV